MAWKVPTVHARARPFCRGGPSRRSQHFGGGLAGEGDGGDLARGETPSCSISHAMRATSVRVLPVPGPAMTAVQAACAADGGVAARGWARAARRPDPALRAAAPGLWARRPVARGFGAGSQARPVPSSESLPGEHFELARAQRGRSRRIRRHSPPCGSPARRACGARPRPRQNPATRSMSAGSSSRRMRISGPRRLISEIYVSCTPLGRGARAQTSRRAPPAGERGFQRAWRRGAGALGAVGQLLHAVQHADGELPVRRRGSARPAPRVSGGLQADTGSRRCPSRWYLPSSG